MPFLARWSLAAALFLAIPVPSGAAVLDLDPHWCRLDAPGDWMQVRNAARKAKIRKASEIKCPTVEAAATLPKTIVLPLPCGRSLTFRQVAINVQDLLDDRVGAFGGTVSEDLRDRYVTGRWAGTVSGTFSVAKGGGPTGPSLGGLNERVYYIGAYELTELQYALITSGILEAFSKEAAPSAAEAARLCADHAAAAKGVRATRVMPAAGLSWYDAVAAGRILNAYFVAVDRRRLAAGKPAYLPWEQGSPGFLRLPDEAEWEYAARGGQISDDRTGAERFYLVATGNKDEPARKGTLREIAVYAEGSSGDQRAGVGGRMPNLLGLYDMVGNVSEYVHNLFRMTRPDRMQGMRGGVVLRGGNVLTPRDRLAISHRAETPLFSARGEVRPTYAGMRLVLAAPVFPDGVDTQDRYRIGMRNTEIEQALAAAHKRLIAAQTTPGAEHRTSARTLALSLSRDAGEGELRSKLDQVIKALEASEAALNDAARRELEERIRSGALGALAIRSIGRLAWLAGLRIEADKKRAKKGSRKSRESLKEDLRRVQRAYDRVEAQVTQQIKHLLSIVRKIAESPPDDIARARTTVRAAFEARGLTQYERFWGQLDLMLAALQKNPDADLFAAFAPVLDDLRARREERFNVDLE